MTPNPTEPFNAERGELLLVIDKKEFILEPSFERVAKLETILGRPILQLTVELVNSQKLSISDIANIIWILCRHPKEPVFNEIGNAVLRHGITKTMVALGPFFRNILKGMTDEGNVDAGGSPTAS